MKHLRACNAAPTLCFASLALLAAGAAAQQNDASIVIGAKKTIHSEVLREERPYWIHLPQSYESETFAQPSYPVLYLLDGNAHFESVSAVVHHLSAFSTGALRIPELIVVALPNTKRTRDLTPTHVQDGPYSQASGGAGAFLRFMQEELFPEIESRYRTLPHRTLIGHSLGGLFALHTLLDGPEIFQAYIAVDPSLWWDDRLLARRVESFAADKLKHPVSVFAALADAPDGWHEDPREEQVYADLVRGFVGTLQSKGSPLLRVGYEYFEDEDHLSVPLRGVYQGLRFIFDGYHAPPSVFSQGPETVRTHFARISKRLNVELLPPERVVSQRGLALIGKDVDQAIEMLKLNVSNYPDSPSVYESLARAYEAGDDAASAIAFYRKSLDLNPGNENARTRLQELKKNRQ